MNVPGLRSPHDMVEGIVHFGRMLDKIRLHAAGQLPADYQPNLGKGFDGWCCQLLGVKYEDVVTRGLRGGTEAEILQWCIAIGRQPAAFEIEAFNSFLSKRGWNDTGSERLAQRKQEAGFADRADIQTFFDLIDADEGQPVHRPGAR